MCGLKAVERRSDGAYAIICSSISVVLDTNVLVPALLILAEAQLLAERSIVAAFAPWQRFDA